MYPRYSCVVDNSGEVMQPITKHWLIITLYQSLEILDYPKIDPDQVAEFAQNFLSRSLSASTVNHALLALRTSMFFQAEHEVGPSGLQDYRGDPGCVASPKQVLVAQG